MRITACAVALLVAWLLRLGVLDLLLLLVLLAVLVDEAINDTEVVLCQHQHILVGTWDT